MNIYGIYVNPEQKDNNFVIIKDGFSLASAFFNVFWALYHSMWVPLIATLIFNFAIVIIGYDTFLPIGKIATMLVFGFLGNDMREYDLQWKKYRLQDVILASSAIEAELKFLERSKE